MQSAAAQHDSAGGVSRRNREGDFRRGDGRFGDGLVAPHQLRAGREVLTANHNLGASFTARRHVAGYHRVIDLPFASRAVAMFHRRSRRGRRLTVVIAISFFMTLIVGTRLSDRALRPQGTDDDAYKELSVLHSITFLSR